MEAFVGALMELTALTQLAISSGGARAKTIDIGVDYLRSGKPVDTYARARVIKSGRRVANVQVEAWQNERSQPIAAMHGHFLLAEAEAAKP
jgi:acyl-coenzyme A thioesterase PaaI-like protein